MWTELLVGVGVVVCGFLMGGSILFAVGACIIGFSAQCAAHSSGCRLLAASFGVVSLLLLGAGCLQGFGLAVSTTGYEKSSSPLSVLLVLAVVFLFQCFAVLPAEDRTDLSMLTHGVRVLGVYAGMGLVGVVLNYVISYFVMGTLADKLNAAESYFNTGTGSLPAEVQDVHYVEGVVALAIGLTAIRGVIRAFVGKEPLQEEKENLE